MKWHLAGFAVSSSLDVFLLEDVSSRGCRQPFFQGHLWMCQRGVRDRKQRLLVFCAVPSGTAYAKAFVVVTEAVQQWSGHSDGFAKLSFLAVSVLDAGRGS